MKNFKLLVATLTCILVLNSCNENKPKANSEKKKQNELTYNKDSASEDVAVLVFNENGQMEYIKSSQDKVFRKTNSGLEYRFVENGKEQKYPKVGDVIYINM